MQRLMALAMLAMAGVAFAAQQPPEPHQTLSCRPDCVWDAWLACRRPLPDGECAEGYLYVCEGCTCGSISNQYCYPSGF